MYVDAGAAEPVAIVGLGVGTLPVVEGPALPELDVEDRVPVVGAELEGCGAAVVVIAAVVVVAGGGGAVVVVPPPEPRLIGAPFKEHKSMMIRYASIVFR